MSGVPNATQPTVAQGTLESGTAHQRNQYLEPAGADQGAHGYNDKASTIAAPHNGGGGMPIGRQISVTLTPEQFEQLYLQPGGVGGKGDLSKRFGNPTPLGVAGFLLCLTPLSIYLMNFGSTNASISSLPLVGTYLTCGGVLLVIAGVMEWILGNTFPFIVFTTFGGYWMSFAILNDPQYALAQAAGGATNSAFNEGIAVWLVIWGVLVFIYLLGSLRTNVAFILLFFTLDIAFFLLAAAYFRIAEGRTDFNILLKAGGGFAFVTTLCGWWIMLSLTLGSTGWPITVPLGDMSAFLSRKA